ncbi:hypothetical protein IEU95_06925 [Hoyosella rhizosphaerae]|uniref:Uncharacterized protein n=1 Tax=Hoyosella rhizosphaerae TaxID=1755582 RepID=A0A916XAX8_9ACTN|nr:hypothetical protein [Hoyosella rhizosphaerae]MBN4926554.1 hypothetical protein [Hoyosella rhizosphaerae]GGC58336.1 hypothetical protein GCM10011410_08540 [Hoyosella rhizosphaerae]
MTHNFVTITVTNLTNEPLVLEDDFSGQPGVELPISAPPRSIDRHTSVEFSISTKADEGVTYNVGGDRDRPVFLQATAAEQDAVQAWSPPVCTTEVFSTASGRYAVSIAPYRTSARKTLLHR